MFMLVPMLAVLPLVSSAPQAQSPTPPAESAPAQPVGLQWKDLISEGNKFKIYGFVRLDVQYDDSRPNNSQTIGYVLSEDPSAPAPIGAGGKNKEDLTMHARLTRLGIDFDGGIVESMDNAKLTAKIEIDFFNSGLNGQTESRSALRMRHAYLKLAWTEWTLLFGQTVDVISPLMPVVNNDLVMWGAGNLGDRRPQMRSEWVRTSGEERYIFQGEIGLTGADDNMDFDNSGTYGAGYRDGETSGLPTLQARVAYGFGLAGQKAEVGLWGDRAWEKPDTSFAGNDEFNSYAVGMDLSLPVYKDIVGLKTEVWTGKNLDDVRGGIFQGVNKTTGEEIGAQGGFVELSYKLSSHNTQYVGYSTDNPENSDLDVGGRAVNKIWYWASRWTYKPLSFGLEYLNWTTRYVGYGDGTDNRVAAFIAYNF